MDDRSADEPPYLLRGERDVISLRNPTEDKRALRRMLTSADRRTGGHFACACLHPLNDNSVGASNLMAGNRKLAYRYGPFKSHFVGALNTVLSCKKYSS